MGIVRNTKTAEIAGFRLPEYFQCPKDIYIKKVQVLNVIIGQGTKARSSSGSCFYSGKYIDECKDDQ